MPRTLSKEELIATVRAVEECGGDDRLSAATRLGVTENTLYVRLRRCKEEGLAIPKGRRPGRKPRVQTEVVQPTPVPSDGIEPVCNKKPPSSDKQAPARAYADVDQASRRAMWRTYVAGGRVDANLRNYLLELELPTLKLTAQKQHFRLAQQKSVDELCSAGAMGMLDAARTFDPEAKVNFWTYAYHRVLGAMLDMMRHEDHVPRLTRQRANRRQDFEREYFDEYGREPTREELLEGLRWNAEELEDSYPQGTTSLQSVLYESESRATAIVDILDACQDGPDAHMVRESFFNETCKGLTFDQQVIVWLYFMRGATMKSIGAALGMSESRVSQLMTQILARLREKALWSVPPPPAISDRRRTNNRRARPAS